MEKGGLLVTELCTTIPNFCLSLSRLQFLHVHNSVLCQMFKTFSGYFFNISHVSSHERWNEPPQTVQRSLCSVCPLWFSVGPCHRPDLVCLHTPCKLGSLNQPLNCSTLRLNRTPYHLKKLNKSRVLGELHSFPSTSTSHVLLHPI